MTSSVQMIRSASLRHSFSHRKYHARSISTHYRVPKNYDRCTQSSSILVRAINEHENLSSSSCTGGTCALIECDGVLIDVHIDGHRVAFNKAFDEIGHSCTSWAPAIYFDLLHLGDSTGPGLIKTYYEMVGWPMMLSTKDRPAFVQKIYDLKQKIFKEMVSSADIPLRRGVESFIDELLQDGIRPVIIGSTSSALQDSVVSAAMMNLGPTRASKIQVLNVAANTKGDDDVSGEENDGAEGDSDTRPPSMTLTFEQRVAAAHSKAKVKAAAAFTRAMNLQNKAGLRVDPMLMAAKARSEMMSPSYISAIVMTMGCTSSQSAMVAASYSLMEAAKGAGLMTAGVPPSLAKRGGYGKAMDAGFDGFGPGGGLTWRKLKAMMQSRQQ